MGEGTGIGQEGRGNLGEVWMGQGLMHARVRDTIRHFVDGRIHCDNATIEPVAAKRPMTDPVVASSMSSHTVADRSLLSGLSSDEANPSRSAMSSYLCCGSFKLTLTQRKP